ncbi:MAG TPA: hypothetical protein VMF66_03815 [Candidatus Acidoferrum sp.]|nr:hypothetical protein [Candidatus Acidoferrum sp.]
MGVDWVRKREERFKRQLQEGVKRGFRPSPLIVPEEEETVIYACHWLGEDKMLPVGTQLTIFNPGNRVRLLVLHASDGVAEVWGEAVKDLKALFAAHPELHNMLPTVIVRVGSPTEVFYVQSVRASRRLAKAV